MQRRPHLRDVVGVVDVDKDDIVVVAADVGAGPT
jgi:hypothetical protein